MALRKGGKFKCTEKQRGSKCYNFDRCIENHTVTVVDKNKSGPGDGTYYIANGFSAGVYATRVQEIRKPTIIIGA